MGKKIRRSSNNKRGYMKHRSIPKSKNEQNIEIACWIGFVALLLLCYLKLGLFITIITGLGIGVIVYVAHLLKKYKNDKKKKKALNIFLIVVLSLGILGLVLLAIFLMFITKS